MSTKQHIQSFRKRWHIQVDEKQEFAAFRSRLLFCLTESIDPPLSHQLLETADKWFNFLRGTIPPAVLRSTPHPFSGLSMWESLYHAGDIPHLAETLDYILQAFRAVSPQCLTQVEQAVQNAIAFSPLAPIRVAMRRDRASVYPAGARILDDVLVNETLDWLDGYPKVATHFENALRTYSSDDTSKYRSALDDLRMSVEQLLRLVLGNRRNLENQKDVLLRWLAQHGLHQQLVNMYATLIDQFALYQNAAVKHGTAYSGCEIEFLIYLSGAFMRLVLTLHEDAPHKPLDMHG